MLTDKELELKTRLDAEMEELYETALRVQTMAAIYEGWLKTKEEIEGFRGGEL